MLKPIIRRAGANGSPRETERGVTMALVAVSIVAIISMAALSIDLGSLFEAKAEAQRSADLAALAAARVLSVTGITGDPTNGTNSWNDVCSGLGSPASVAAISVANQNLVGGAAPSTVKVYYGTKAGVGTEEQCEKNGAAFGVNPIVQVYVQQAKIPSFFAPIFSFVTSGTTANSGVSATATAEVFNSSNSAAYAGAMVPVQPRCVKPWIIPNYDHFTGAAYVDVNTGAINNPGVFDTGTNSGGVIGEPQSIGADCLNSATDCKPALNHMLNNPPGWFPGPFSPPPNVLEYIPALLEGSPTAVPSCAASPYQQAITGCDQSTNYACGTPSTDAGATKADLSFNPGGGTGNTGGGGTLDTSTGALCLTNQSNGGSDQLMQGTPTAPPFPFEINAGSGNPLVKAGLVASGDIISSSNSIVTLPIADYGGAKLAGVNPAVSIVGFMQVFIQNIYPSGNLEVIVLNVSGCGEKAAGNASVSGTSPVPIRLITPP